ncbi:MAG: hypothetical protein WCQ55_01185 [Paludibacteraceae bacterium]
MASFIVVSSDDRLSGLVEAIKKSLPLNPCVDTHISTGEILRSGDKYIYKYTIFNGSLDDTKEEGSDLNTLIRNQVAAFRHAYSIRSTVNILFLENPMNEQESETLDVWLQEFEQVFDADKDLHLYRVLFTYNLDKPTDVCCQIPPILIKNYLNRRNEFKHKNCSSVIYIDNANSLAAALCLNKKDHDIKIPRILADFIMLVSSTNDNYHVYNAINPSEGNLHCFSVGYAESMYYFPDVEQYYEHADLRNLYGKFLTDNDNTENIDDKSAMCVENYPFGLRQRNGRLKRYGNVPFNKNISDHLGSADKIIDDSIIGLKNLLLSERKKEIEDFEKSKELVELEDLVQSRNRDLGCVCKKEDETEDDFLVRKSVMQKEKESAEKALKAKREGFTPDCPLYVSRVEIYDDISGLDLDKQAESLAKLENQYLDLVEFAKGKKFYDYVKCAIGGDSDSQQIDESESHISDIEDSRQNQESGSKNNLGCWSRFLFWRRIRKNEDVISSIPTKGPDVVPSTQLDLIRLIRTQLGLKRSYAVFLQDKQSVEDKYVCEINFCKKFKLTEHSHHFYPLIDLPELKKECDKTSNARIARTIQLWNEEEEEKTLTKLEKFIVKESKEYVKQYSFVDWDSPFPFVSKIDDTILPEICNNLLAKSSPFVNYHVTSMEAPNNVICALYSDRREFQDEIDSVKTSIDNVQCISVYRSTHTASKICMFQFLPLTQDVLDNLVDLNLDDKSQFGANLSNDDIETENSENSSRAITSEFWGNDI